jgi:asparagine synthase (glutamine-hydrolysing)
MLNLYISMVEKWASYNNGQCEAYLKGYIYYRNQLIIFEELVDLIIRAINNGSLGELLDTLDGCFLCVIKTDKYFFAFVDRARSIPFFYAQSSTIVFASNDAYWIKENVAAKDYDEISASEFLLTGYVTGGDTLYANIHQLQPGEYLLLMGNKLIIHRYFKFFHQNTYLLAEPQLLELLDRVVLNVFTRFIHWAGGRAIIIPLSGGYDSRLIATMVKKLKYDNVIAFSYGKPGNKEAHVSRQVAESLGIRWEFVDYSNELWRRWFQTDERKAYYRTADGLSSVPHIQDWPAVWELRKRRLIPEDSVFAPGHTVTLALKDGPTESTSEALTKAIYSKHYSLWPKWKVSQEIRGRLEEKIGETFNSLPKNSIDWAVDFFEAWELQERQVKFIVNSVRVYDYFGYDWYLPLWDHELIEYWRRVPLNIRIGKNIFKTYVKEQYKTATGLDIPINYSPLNNLKSRVARTPLKTAGRRVYRALRAASNKRNQYHGHFLASFGVMREEQFNELYSGYETIASFLSLERLGEIQFE